MSRISDYCRYYKQQHISTTTTTTATATATPTTTTKSDSLCSFVLFEQWFHF